MVKYVSFALTETQENMELFPAMLTAIPAPPELYYSNLLYFFTKNEEMQ